MNDDEPSGRGRSAARLVKAVGHGSSGGHARTLNRNQVELHHHHSHQPSEPRDMEFHEYPKFIRRDGKVDLIAQDEAEEAAMRAGETVMRETDERARLLKVAEVKDVKVDGRWSLEKITKAITEAGFDASLNPFE